MYERGCAVVCGVVVAVVGGDGASVLDGVAVVGGGGVVVVCCVGAVSVGVVVVVDVVGCGAEVVWWC